MKASVELWHLSGNKNKIRNQAGEKKLKKESREKEKIKKEIKG